MAPKVTLSAPQQEGENESFEKINEEDEPALGMVRLSDLQQDFNIRENRIVNIEEKLLDEQLRLACQKEELDKEVTRLQVRQTSFNHEQKLFEKEKDLEEREKSFTRWRKTLS